jgi:alpha-glucosidase (family GH31 glycosyl hydrolase)
MNRIHRQKTYGARVCDPQQRGRSGGLRATIYPLSFFSLLFFLFTTSLSHAKDDLVWGISAINLRSPLSAPPSLGDLTRDNSHTVSLNRFHLVGGEDRPATPTECRIAYTKDDLVILFRCTEDNLSFPTISHNDDWYSDLRAPSDQDSEFPDKVDLYVQPDMRSHTFYQFAATLDGLNFGCRHSPRSKSEDLAGTDEDAKTLVSPNITKVADFTATITKRTNEWLVLFTVPWRTIGGKPTNCFGLLPFRTRWRDGELSSPVAMDFNERPPLDLFIETHFSEASPAPGFSGSLIQLPSGIFRWQKPARLTYPDSKTINQIWTFQQSLSESTDTNNLARRLHLTQRWIDLLTVEGFSFHASGGGAVPVEMAPYILRRNVNIALRGTNTVHACQLLDNYLEKLDQASRNWFADGSLADILDDEWKSVSKVESLTTSNNVLLMRCGAGNHTVNLHLSLPQSGGIRIYGDDEGHFKPASVLPLKATQSGDRYTIQTTSSLTVSIEQSPFAINIYDGLRTTTVSPGFAFRFNQQGEVIAADFKTRLAPHESIFGFGERYDHFSQTGHILTLWGTDDWVGNTIGLLNQTYKPIPIYHSSRQYMVFDNSSYRLRADLGKTHPEQLRLTQQGPVFDYYFWIGSPSDSLESYTELTGKPVLPPKWAFEPWMGRTGRGWNKPSSNMVAEEEKVTEQFEKLDIPHSAIYAEGGGNPESPELNAFMAARGIKVLSWFYPIISSATQAKLMPELKPAELPVLHTTDPWDHVDFSNPNAPELMRRVWNQRLTAGVAGSMIDFGDRVTGDAVFFNGKRGDEMHNFYSYDYHRTCAEIFREKRGDDFILFGRAAAPGTQKWVAQFGGDHPSNFKGLQCVLTGALNLTSCGFSTWGSDLGGFLGWPEPAVYLRWTEFGCFSPLMRCHGRTPREPWNYGDAAVANYKYYTWVRENLLNYIYNAAVESHVTGLPMMRSMAVAFPGESGLPTVNDEYMFGDDLLVAPITCENNSRIIRFPTGHWTSLWTGKPVSGPANLVMDAPLNTIPVYLKSGALIPVQLNPSLQFGESMSRSRINALILTPPESHEVVSLPDKQGPDIRATFQSKTSGFELTIENLSTLDYLLVYGMMPSQLAMDGQPLPKVGAVPTTSSSAGWYFDAKLNRTVIHLPTGDVNAKHTFNFVP